MKPIARSRSSKRRAVRSLIDPDTGAHTHAVARRGCLGRVPDSHDAFFPPQTRYAVGCREKSFRQVVLAYPAMDTSLADSQTVNVAFDFQLSDIEQGLASLPRARWARIAGWSSILVVAALIAWRLREGRDPGYVILLGVFLMVVLFVGRDPSKRIAKRVYEGLPPEARHVELSFNQQGIKLTTGSESTETPWTQLSHVLDSRSSILLFESRSNAQIVPKRALTPEQYSVLHALVRRHVVRRNEPWLTPQITVRIAIYAVLFGAFWFFYQHRH